MEERKNHMHLCFDARSCNEGFARMAVAAFMTEMNPTLEQVADVKTAVSEAVTNAIVHGYSNAEKQVEMICDQMGHRMRVTIIDHGVGMEDVALAMKPFYTSKPEMERSGMGFAFMEAFMDEVTVESRPGVGTKVVMSKYIGSRNPREDVR
jgi:stage II sporulation protein AB (anti-sigma F factor)